MTGSTQVVPVQKLPGNLVSKTDIDLFTTLKKLDQILDGWMDGRMDGRMEGWMDLWMRGGMDGGFVRRRVFQNWLFRKDMFKVPVQIG